MLRSRAARAPRLVALTLGRQQDRRGGYPNHPPQQQPQHQPQQGQYDQQYQQPQQNQSQQQQHQYQPQQQQQQHQYQPQQPQQQQQQPQQPQQQQQYQQPQQQQYQQYQQQYQQPQYPYSYPYQPQQSYPNYYPPNYSSYYQQYNPYNPTQHYQQNYNNQPQYPQHTARPNPAPTTPPPQSTSQTPPPPPQSASQTAPQYTPPSPQAVSQPPAQTFPQTSQSPPRPFSQTSQSSPRSYGSSQSPSQTPATQTSSTPKQTPREPEPLKETPPRTTQTASKPAQKAAPSPLPPFQPTATSTPPAPARVGKEAKDFSFSSKPEQPKVVATPTPTPTVNKYNFTAQSKTAPAQQQQQQQQQSKQQTHIPASASMPKQAHIPASASMTADFSKLLQSITKKPTPPTTTSPRAAPSFVRSTTAPLTPATATNGSIGDIISALSSANTSSKTTKDGRKQHFAPSEQRLARAQERRQKILERRKQMLESRPRQVSSEFFERQLKERRRSTRDRTEDSEYQVALKSLLQVAAQLSPAFDLEQNFVVPANIKKEFAARFAAESPVAPTRTAIPTLPRGEEDDETSALFGKAAQNVDEMAEMARLRARNDLTGEESDRLRELELAQEQREKSLSKQDRKDIDEVKIAKGEEVVPEVRADAQAVVAQAAQTPPGEDVDPEAAAEMKEIENLNSAKKRFPNENKYMGTLNMFFLATALGGAKREADEDTKAFMGAIFSSAQDRPPARPETRSGETLSDTVLSIRSDRSLLGPLTVLHTSPVAMYKFQDLMDVDSQERYEGQLFMYENWQMVVEGIYYGPILWANSYLRQILPKLRKLQSKKDWQFQMDNRSRQISRAVQARREKEGKVIRKDIISPRHFRDNYKTYNPLQEPELVLRRPVFPTEGREKLFDLAASAVLKNPSYTMKQKRGLISNYGYGFQNMGIKMPKAIPPELSDEKLRLEFQREDRHKREKARKRHRKMALRQEERAVINERMYYIPKVDYNLDDMDRRNAKSTAPL